MSIPRFAACADRQSTASRHCAQLNSRAHARCANLRACSSSNNETTCHPVRCLAVRCRACGRNVSRDVGRNGLRRRARCHQRRRASQSSSEMSIAGSCRATELPRIASNDGTWPGLRRVRSVTMARGSRDQLCWRRSPTANALERGVAMTAQAAGKCHVEGQNLAMSCPRRGFLVILLER